MCMPCGSTSSCDVYTCEECRSEYHREGTYEELYECFGKIYTCPYCSNKDIKIEVKTNIINFVELCEDYDMDDAYGILVEQGDCCVFPSGESGFYKWEKEQLKNN